MISTSSLPSVKTPVYAVDVPGEPVPDEFVASDYVHVSIGDVVAHLANEWEFPVEALIEIALRYGTRNLDIAMGEHLRDVITTIGKSAEPG